RIGRAEGHDVPLAAPRRWREGADRSEQRLAARGPRARTLELVGAERPGLATRQVQIVVVEADADAERALRAVEVEVAALVALLTNLLIAGPALRVVRVLDHPLGGAVGRLLAAASDAARERGRRDTLAATGVAQRTSVAGRVRAAHDRSADTDARHARRRGGARIVVVAAGAVDCGA